MPSLFLTPDLSSDLLVLPEEESKHCVKVLRMRSGDPLMLTDGLGTLCHAQVLQADPKGCTVTITQRIPNYGRRNHHLHIAVAPTKNNERLEWFVEKAVEIGIDEITPLICDHSERRVLKTDRLEKIIDSAMKQSLKAYRPTLNQPTPFKTFIENLSSYPTSNSSLSEKTVNPDQTDPLRLICYCDGDRKSLHDLYRPGQSAIVLIGPEGDFSPEEIHLALSNDFHPVTLGPCRLRTETAALYATTAINFLNS